MKCSEKTESPAGIEPMTFHRLDALTTELSKRGERSKIICISPSDELKYLFLM